MSLDFDKIKINKEKVGFFRFKKLNDFYLLTNDISLVELSEQEFKNFLEGTLDEKEKVYSQLVKRGFIKDKTSHQTIIDEYRIKNRFLFSMGASLHIVVVTKRCNQLCVYCQAGSSELQKDYDMTKETAKKVVDIIFQSKSNSINIEFQGGEPLLNWEVVRFIVEYAKEKNKIAKKRLMFSLVTNLSLMTDKKYNYLILAGVNICTSLDGPAHVHDKNRPFPNGKGSYKEVTSWIEKSAKLSGKRRISALPTLTKYSLDHIEEVIDEYIKFCFPAIHLRQLSFLGRSSGGKNKEEFGYTAEEFVTAWKRGLDYIIQKNKEGVFIYERFVAIVLLKIIKGKSSAFLDLRSPCGAGIGQLAYFYDGGIYSCDEARMLGDDTFLLGTVDNTYNELIINNKKLKTIITSSVLDNCSCNECVYKPYCGICPVQNYFIYKNLFPNIKETDICKIHTGMLDYIFTKIKDEETAKIFSRWVS